MTKSEIQDWLITAVAGLLHIRRETINIHEPLANYGLSSRDAVMLSGELEELLDRRLSATLAYEYPSIEQLSLHLADDKAHETSAAQFADPSTEPMAIIGMSCRFPGANDAESFWELLRNGTDAITTVPNDRWEPEAFYDSDSSAPGKSTSYWGGFLDNIDQFDPFFFGISPIEAKYMDPQQRLLLELSTEALDDAGYMKDTISGSDTGVFIGISLNEYSQRQFADPALIASHSGTGNALSIAANRISYFFNIHGPSMAIDSACSSSLAAVHLACQSIRNGECKMAVAGGVNMILSPAHSIAFSKAGVLASDGRCKSFDSRANGYVRGEGAGLVIIKKLSAALADGDHVHAVILGSAMRQDGRTNGLMAPSTDGQEALLTQAYLSAGILPGAVQYVETHGTGTLLGDAMEARALGAVVGVNRKNGACAIGSVKTNIGHLEAAAGIAGLIKVVLSLKHREIPPSLHYHSPNPHIAFDALNLRVAQVLNQWPAGSGQALAGVSSFGFGGTNVHMVVGEAPYQTNDSGTSTYSLLAISAGSLNSLRSLAGSFGELLATDSSITTNDICYAASLRRSQFDYRFATISNSREEFAANLKAFINHEHRAAEKIPLQTPKLAFVFSGQGGQWFGMARDLLKDEPVFYRALARIDFIIGQNFGWSLLDELHAEQVSRMDEIDIVQPALFAIQIALAELWESWNIKPDAVVGHSMGEIAAAYVAGILTLEDSVRIICTRSQLLKKLRGKGAMLATGLSPQEAQALLIKYDDDISLAVINSPVSTVLSGNPETIGKVRDFLEAEKLFCRLVNVDVASHSPQIDSLRTDLLAELQGLQPQPSRLPFYSTLIGSRADHINFDARYWIDNLRQPVLFAEATENLLNSEHGVFIEISPHPVLLGSIQQSLHADQPFVRLLPSLRREEPARKVLLESLGILYTEGFTIDWKKLFPWRGNYVRLPLIPWQRQRYWLETRAYKDRQPRNQLHPLLGDRVHLAHLPSTFVWQQEFNEELYHFIADHQIENEAVFPAAGYVEMALQAAKEANLHSTHTLCDLVFKQRMTLGQSCLMQSLLAPQEDENFLFNVYSKVSSQDDWTLNATATFTTRHRIDNSNTEFGSSLDSVRSRLTREYHAAEIYKNLKDRGVDYGPQFRGIKRIWSGAYEALGLIELPDTVKWHSNLFQIHPVLLDACLQVLAAIQDTSYNHDHYMPVGCKRIEFHLLPERFVWSHVMLRSAPDADVIHIDIKIFNERNQVIAGLVDFQLQRISRHIRHSPSEDIWLYRVSWQPDKSVANTSPVKVHARRWLIFADEEGFAEQLARRLREAGDTCELLRLQELIDGSENFNEKAIFERIDKSLASFPVYGILHLWSLSIPKRPHQALMAGCGSTLLIVQDLLRRIAATPRLWLITKGAQGVRAAEPVSAEQSPLWGLGKVISFEHPELKCVRIDLDSAQSVDEALPDLVDLFSTVGAEDQFAFRGGVRFVPRLVPFALPFSPNTIEIRQDATYLITGGLGGLGLKTAGWMATRGARHLVLMGRNKPSIEATALVDQLKQQGVEVIIALGDVSDRAQLAIVFKTIATSLPELRGVIHAAGVLDDASISNLSAERMNKVMAPKIQGTWNLHEATLAHDLDFFVLFSSAISVLGSPGQANYAAASTYLDAMAHYRRNLALPAISINWGPWAEVGLAATVAGRLREQNASDQHLIKVIQIAQGLEILEQLLTQTTPQVVVLPFNLKNLLELYPSAAGMPFFAEVAGSNVIAARHYSRPNLRQEYVAPRNEIEHKIADLWRQTLHIDRVGMQDSFFELGGDSVLAAQILSLTQKAYGIRINPQDAFKAFTVERLAELLSEELISKIAAMSEEEAEHHLSKGTTL